mgnify:CR=1 FL=1
MPSPVKVFVSYAKADLKHLQALIKHLDPMRKQELIEVWSDQLLEFGTEIRPEIERRLQAARIILLLVSADFMNSPEIMDTQLPLALAQQKAGKALIVPIRVRPVDLSGQKFAEFTSLPSNDGPPVSKSSDADDVWAEIAIDIRKFVEKLGPQPVQQQSGSVSVNSIREVIGPPAAAGDAPARIKVLFMCADPRVEGAHLRLGAEVRDIAAKLRASDAARASIELVTEWAVRAKDLPDIFLRHEPQVVHFSGHGSKKGRLAFEDDEGNVNLLDREIIGRLFEIHGESVRCVVLNACYSKAQAELLRRHVDFVVGMEGEVGDAGARAFASAFYLALGNGRSVKKAFDSGCLQNELEHLPDSKTPVLVARKGADPAKVKLVG